MCWKNRMKYLVNQFIFRNGLTKPIFLSVRRQGINNSCTHWPLSLMEVNRIYCLLVWTMLPVENIKLADILIGVTWSIIASQLLRASCGVSLADDIQQHPACGASCSQGTLNSPAATHAVSGFRAQNTSPPDVLSYLHLDLPSVLFYPGLAIRVCMNFSFIPFVFTMNRSNTKSCWKKKCAMENVCTHRQDVTNEFKKG